MSALRGAAIEGESDGQRAVEEAKSFGGEGDLFHADAQRRRVLEQYVPMRPRAGVIDGIASSTDVLGRRSLDELRNTREGPP